MKTKTYLANAIDTADMKAQYDAEAKKIVADKGVLSWIVKYTVKEMKDCTLEEIADAIGCRVVDLFDNTYTITCPDCGKEINIVFNIKGFEG